MLSLSEKNNWRISQIKRPHLLRLARVSNDEDLSIDYFLGATGTAPSMLIVLDSLNLSETDNDYKWIMTTTYPSDGDKEILSPDETFNDPYLNGYSQGPVFQIMFWLDFNEDQFPGA